MKQSGGGAQSDHPGKTIYISCPGDMSAAVGLAQDIVNQINTELPLAERWQTYHWSHHEEAYSSWKTYQDQIRDPSEPAFGVMLTFLGERVGMPLPAEFLSRKQPDLSSYPWLTAEERPPEGKAPLTGTLFEYVSWPKDRKHHYVIFRGDKEAIEDRDNSAEQRNFGFEFRRSQITGGASQFPRGKESEQQDYNQQIHWLDVFVQNVIHKGATPVYYFGERGAHDEQAAVAGLKEVLEKILRHAMGVGQERVFEPKGLKYYDVDDAGFFFGRDDETREIADRLLQLSNDSHRMPVVLLHSQNGEGKSSLLRAGLLGGIKERKLADFGKSYGVLLTPDDLNDGDPIIALADCIDRALEEASAIGAALRKYVESARPEELLRLTRETLQKGGWDNFFLCVDQAEDIIAPAIAAENTSETASRLWEMIEKLATNRLAMAIIAVADQHVKDFEAIAPALAHKRYRYPLGVPGSAAIRQIARATLAAAVGERQDVVSEEIAEQAITLLQGEKSGPVLPLLSLVLKEWMDERRRFYSQRLTSDEIRERVSADAERPKVPRLNGIIDDLGERAWQAARYDRNLLSKPKLDALMDALTVWQRAVDTNHIAMRLQSAEADHPAFREAAPLLEALRDCRFIYAPTRGKWRLTHEIILTSWRQAKAWRDQKRHLHRGIRRIENFLRSGPIRKDLSFASRFWLRHRGSLNRDIVEAIRSLLTEFIEEAPHGFRSRLFVEAMRIGDADYLKSWFSAIDHWPTEEQRSVVTMLDDGAAALAAAAGRGSIEELKWLLSRPEISVRATDDLHWNAIHHAARAGHAAAVEFLLETVRAGPQFATSARYIDSRTSDGWTALHQAAYQGHDDVVEILLSHGADARLKTDTGWTALHSAAYNGHATICEHLLAVRQAPDLEARNEHGWTALHQASANGHLKVAAELIRVGAQVNAITLKGRTPLHMAAMNDRLEIAELLLAKEADVNFQADVLADGTEANMATPLHSAASAASPHMLWRLISAGADVDRPTRKLLTPLHYAAIHGRWDLGAALIEGGATIEATTSHKRTSLMQAVQSRQRQFVAGLIGRGAKVTSTDNQGWTALHLAAHFGDYPLVRMLLEAGADPNANEPGLTPLHRAVDSGSEACVRALLDKGADVNAPTVADDPWTPLHKACKNDLPNIVTLLLEYNARLDVTTGRGHSALDLSGPQTRPLIEERGARSGWAPLLAAAKTGIAENVARILSIGEIDIDGTDEKLATALHHVVQGGNGIEGRIECMKLLLAAGASTSLTTKKGLTPLHVAVKVGSERLVHELARQEDVMICSNKKMTPLHTASLMGRTDIAASLVDKHADPMDRSPGFSSIAIAMAFERWDLLDILDPESQADPQSDKVLEQDIDAVLGNPSVSLDADVAEPEEFGLTKETMANVRSEVRRVIEQQLRTAPVLETWLEIVSIAVKNAGGRSEQVISRLSEGRPKPAVV